MGGAYRRQGTILLVRKRVGNLLPGDYSVYIDATRIKGGNIHVEARILGMAEMPMEERKGEANVRETT